MSGNIDPKRVEVVKAEVEAKPDAVEVALEIRIADLETGEAADEESTKAMLLSIVGLQEASLKHSVALALVLAVAFYISGRALGA